MCTVAPSIENNFEKSMEFTSSLVHDVFFSTHCDVSRFVVRTLHILLPTVSPLLQFHRKIFPSTHELSLHRPKTERFVQMNLCNFQAKA